MWRVDYIQSQCKDANRCEFAPRDTGDANWATWLPRMHDIHVFSASWKISTRVENCMTHCRLRQSSKSLLICPVVSDFFVCFYLHEWREKHPTSKIEQGNANIHFAFSVHTPLQYLPDDFINFIHIHISIKAHNLSVHLLSSNWTHDLGVATQQAHNVIRRWYLVKFRLRHRVTKIQCKFNI